MISASKEFKEKLKNDADLVNYADVTLSNGTTLHLEPKDFMIGGCSVDDKTTDGKFGVGFAIGKTLSIRIANHDQRFSQYDFYNSIIYLYVALALDDGTIEKIRKGVYYTTVPETPGDIIEINAVDGMYLLDRDYSASSTVYPATLQRILSDCCLDCGVPIGFKEFDNMNFVVAQKPDGVTYRQVVSYVAQIAGYNARINNNGYLQLVWYNTEILERYLINGGNFKVYPHDTVMDGGNFKDYSSDTVFEGALFNDPMPEHIFRVKTLNVSTDDVEITGIRIKNGDSEYLAGEDGYVIEISGNPFSEGNEKNIAEYLGKRMIGLAFRPFSAQILSNPLYEPFEVVMISDRKGNVYKSLVNSVSYTIGSYTQIACEAEDPVRNGSRYISPAASAVVEARRNAEKQISAYDKAVQNMNQLAMNAMGFHTTYEEQADGSRITYLHDKPTLEESKTIYKQTIDGFFISTDGGKSYTAGFDSQGNAIVNILYAIGIVCDWIKGGTLTLGGDNNTNGVLSILNSSGTQIGRWDKEGIVATKGSFSGELKAATGSFTGTVNATTLKSANASITGGYLDISTSSEYDNIIRLKSGNHVLILRPNGVEVDYTNGTGEFFSGGINLTTGSSNYLFFVLNEDNLIYDGSFSVHGTKSRIASTKNYSDRLLYCYEMAKPYFGDIGEAELDENGTCYIFLDDIFEETVNTELNYQVFLQKYGNGDLWIEKRFPNYFIVKGTPKLNFAWEIKARQLNFESERLETFAREDKKETIDYEAESEKYIENYYAEVFNYEKSY